MDYDCANAIEEEDINVFHGILEEVAQTHANRSRNRRVTGVQSGNCKYYRIRHKDDWVDETGNGNNEYRYTSHVEEREKHQGRREGLIEHFMFLITSGY